ncbi:MAG TPA: VCBS repeat-containing protein, partial [Pirellulales bacterium]|nr:VCBS repeat-containing protein [Pirellulales bacterium]
KKSNGSIPDALAYLDETLAAAEEDDWAEVVGHAFFLKNTVLPEAWSRSDMRRIDRNVLDFVLYEFSSACRPASHEVPDSRPVAVAFKEFAPQLPPLANVVDLELADFDLDGSLDVIVLRESAVEVYVRADDGAKWRRLTSVAIASGFDRLLVADLDQDNPYEVGTKANKELQAAEAARSGPSPSGPSPNPPSRAPPDDGSGDSRVALPGGVKHDAYLDQMKLHAVDVDFAVYGPAGIRFCATTSTE